MDIRKLQRAIVDGLEDVKAQNIVVFNTEHLTPMFERVIVASGTSNRQTKALASSVREAVKSRGMPVLSTEGAENGEWIIVDCGAAVAHIMQPLIRDYYRLEEIWGGKPVRIKLVDGAETKALPKAETMVPARKKVMVVAGAKQGARHKAPAPAAKSKTRKATTAKAVSGRAVPRKSTTAKKSARKPPAAKTVRRSR
jgi:ribosome-associated protein